MLFLVAGFVGLSQAMSVHKCKQAVGIHSGPAWLRWGSTIIQVEQYYWETQQEQEKKTFFTSQFCTVLNSFCSFSSNLCISAKWKQFSRQILIIPRCSVPQTIPGALRLESNSTASPGLSESLNFIARFLAAKLPSAKTNGSWVRVKRTLFNWHWRPRRMLTKR